MKKFLLGFASLFLFIFAFVSPVQAIDFPGAGQGLLNNATDAVSENVGGLVDDVFDDLFDKLRGGAANPSGKFELPSADKFNSIGQNTSLRQFILNILNFFLSFLGLLGTAAIIYAGYLMVAGAGDDSMHEKGKKILMYAAIGVIVVLTSFALVNTLIQHAGQGTGDRGEVTSSTNTSTQVAGGSTLSNESNTKTDFSNYTTSSSLSSGAIVIADNTTEASSNVIDFGTGFSTDLETASSGIYFWFSSPADVTFDFGDGTQGRLNTIDNLSNSIQHAFGEEKTYRIRAIATAQDGTQAIDEKSLIVGGVSAYFETSEENPVVGQNINFDASRSSTSSGTIVNYEWACETSTSGAECPSSLPNGKILTTTFDKAGEYKITLTVFDSQNSQSTYSDSIEVIGNQPTATFETSSANDNLRPALFIFDASASTDVFGNSSGLTYQWNFDGVSETTTASTISHEFSTTGDKTISLTVSQELDGQTLSSVSAADSITVESTLGLEIESASTARTGESVLFQAKSEQTNDFAWDFGDEKNYSEADVLYVFEESGPKTVSLTGFGDEDQTRTISKNISILNREGPTALAEVLVNGNLILGTEIETTLGDQLEFNGFSVDPENSRTDVVETWFVNDSVVSSEARVAAAINSVGDFEVKLVASYRDDPNIQDELVLPVSVLGALPVVNDLEVEINSLNQATLTADANDPDGEIVNYIFDVLEQGEVVASKSTTTNTATFDLDQYSGSRQYNFRVKVEDDSGATAEFTHSETFLITSTFVNSAPTIGISATPGNSGDTTTKFTFQASGSDADGDALDYTWTFPNGDTIFGDLVQNYQFAESGTFEVFLSATDGSDTVQTSVSMNISLAEETAADNLAAAEEDLEAAEQELVDAEEALNAAQEAQRNLPADATAEEIAAAEQAVLDAQSVFDEAKVAFEVAETAFFEAENAMLAEQNTPPTGGISQISPGLAGDTSTLFSFYAAGADDDLDPLAFQWDFGGAGIANVQNAAFQFSQAGDYQVKLTISDGIDSITESVTINIVDAGENFESVEFEPSPETTEIQSEQDEETSDPVEISDENISIGSATGEGDLEVTTSTDIHLYAEVPEMPDAALFFQWDLGNGQTQIGQKASFKYDDISTCGDGTDGFGTKTTDADENIIDCTYSVTLTVTNTADNSSAQTSINIVVSEELE